MNIDIVNKQVAQELNIRESNVKLINHFYWKKVKNHLYGYDHRPLNIDNICVLYPNKRTLKKAITLTIKKLRGLAKSKKFIIGSVRHTSYMDEYRTLLRNYLKIRKACKFTN